MILKKVYKHIVLETINKLFFLTYPFSTSFLLRVFGVKLGINNRIYNPLIFHNTNFANLKIGNNCHIGRDVFFDLLDEISIGDNVTISMRSTFITHTDVGDSPLQHMGYESSHDKIYIGNGVYIGSGVTVLQGVKVGENSIIGSGALVNKDVPPNSVVFGVPGKVIKKVQT